MITDIPIAMAPPRIQALHRELFPLPGNFGYVAGGVIRDTLAGFERKDVDIFFPTEREWRGALGAMLPATCRFVNTNAVGLTVPRLGDVDVCRASFRSPMDMLERFDFVCCCAALTSTHYYRHRDFEEEATAHLLSVNNAANATRERADRLIAKGWLMPRSIVDSLPLRFPVGYP